MEKLLLFEAFKSKTISGVYKFIKKMGISKGVYKSFINQFKELADILDIRLSEIPEEKVLYLNKRKAIDYRPEGSGITAIKFWFSIDGGYLGKTGVGDKVYKSKGVDLLIDDELSILEARGLKTGRLEPVNNYSELVTGSMVVGIFTPYKNQYSNMSLATIVREGNKIYAIQNVSDGGAPDGNDWTRYGNLSWALGDIYNKGNDHFKLNHYYPSESKLGYDEKYYETEYNLPISKSGNLSSWDSLAERNDLIEKSDFSIIINLTDLGDKKSKKQEERKLSKKVDLTDLEIKDININRYLSNIVNRLRGDKFDDFRSLEKIITLILGKYPIFIMLLYSTWNSDIKNLMRDVVHGTNLEDIKFKYVKLYKKSIDNKLGIEKSLNILYNSGNDNILEISNIAKSLNNDIYKWIKSKDIKTPGDFIEITHRLNYINSLFTDAYTRSDIFYGISSSIINPSTVQYILKESEELDTSNDLKRMKKIEENIKRILN